MHYYYRILCFDYKVMSVDYFMSTCSLWEVFLAVENLKYLDRNSWEQARLIAYMDGKSHFKSVKKITDVMDLPWDDNKDIEIEKVETWLKKDISNKEISDLRKLASKWGKNE